MLNTSWVVGINRLSLAISQQPSFDAAQYLDSDQAVAEYLTAILEENNAGLLAAALGDVARARGMTEIGAGPAGLNCGLGEAVRCGGGRAAGKTLNAI